MTPAEVREARTAMGLDQHGLADAMGIKSRVTVGGWEKDGGDKPITGPASRLLTYMMQGVLDDRMKAVIPEYLAGTDLDGGDSEFIIRMHRPRFVGMITDRPAPGCDAMEGPTGEWLNVIQWTDDPSAPPGWDVDDLLRGALTAWEIYTQDAFEQS